MSKLEDPRSHSGPKRVEFDLYREPSNRIQEDPKRLVADALKDKELHNLKSEFYNRDQKAKQYEDKCTSLTSKVDSLVKFLEEERSLRKAAEVDSKKKDIKIEDLQLQLEAIKEKVDFQSKNYNEMQENVVKTKAENDRLRREKADFMEEKQKQQFQILDMESRLRANQKLQEEKEKQFEICAKEKYDAQNRQFLLQQEYNENTSKQFDVLRMNN